MANARAVHRTAQAGPPHDGQAPLGQRGHLSLQVDGRIMRAGCEGLVVWVGCGSGCEGCVGWLFVLQAPTIPVEL